MTIRNDAKAGLPADYAYTAADAGIHVFSVNLKTVTPNSVVWSLSVVDASNAATLATLHQLRALGVRIALDDFGTGYSSLSYLRSFPFDKIKIDRCFVSDLSEASEDSLAILRAVASLGISLGIATTAEGVETEEQLARVRAEGCTEMQGYLFSPPRPLAEVHDLYLDREVAAASAA